LSQTSGYFRGEEVVAFYTDENQEEVDFDSYEILFNEIV
jgi:hypothetical protein